ncbi:hypothetical protein PHIREBALL_156 [Bacillus phage Phireball]|uniref:Uncharacterized protein n=1 Tax=Bacillus phage SageFayge TaxID=1805954 RepID=A0A143FMT2_9CAUD|nr:hypothetical protein SAGEFAYGE_156 [Bacillus phage SageFayge]AMW63076.1 hypothetical protein SAGEFAYGE_156 [Bacillus phage SageFayge]QDH49430.1 hypothetical protein PHIREBALL_156 [Bacillus phage Phireball]ULF49361.1 hypothetical protein [Bacillus phage MrBubbles]
MAEEYMDLHFIGLDVLPHLTKGWFRKEGTTDAYRIIEGNIIHWDMLNKEQKHDNSLPFAVLAQGTFVYQDYSESKNFKEIIGSNNTWLMEETDIKGLMTAGKKFITLEHEFTRLLDVIVLNVNEGQVRPMLLDDFLYAMHELDLEEIQQIMDEATFWKEI